MIDNSVIECVAGDIAERFSPEKIILFGSHALGTANDDSDIDLLIVMDSPLPRHKRTSQLRLIFNPQPAPMDILVYTPDEVRHWNGVVNHIVTEAFSHGRILYER